MNIKDRQFLPSNNYQFKSDRCQSRDIPLNTTSTAGVICVILTSKRMANTILHKSETRGFANHGWLRSSHTFSFAGYYNPERILFGALRVLNDDYVEGGQGFDTHPHENMEIISIPLEGDSEHQASRKNQYSSGIPLSSASVKTGPSLHTKILPTLHLPHLPKPHFILFSRVV